MSKSNEEIKQIFISPSPPVRHRSVTLALFASTSCLQAASQQRYKEFCDSCKAFNSRQMAAVKKEQEKKEAPEETQSGVVEKPTPTSAATKQPNKRTKSAGKRK